MTKSRASQHLAAAAMVWVLMAGAGWASAEFTAYPASEPRLRTDARWNIDATARLLAGLPPGGAAQQRLADTDAWRQHSAAMQADWAKLKSARVDPIQAWRDRQMPEQCPTGKSLLYPFSGPDFLNAYWLFPACETFVLFGLEHVGAVPDMASMSVQEFARLLGDVRIASKDLFNRNYFITDHMTRQLRTAQLRGVVPLILTSMALSGLEVLRVEDHPLGAQSSATAAPESGVVAATRRGASLRHPQGIAIDFRPAGSHDTKRLIYFSVDATDASLAQHPEFVAFLRQFAPSTTLLKSASYLLHGREFSRLRDTLLDVSGFVAQDDSGVPYRMLVSRGFDLRLYGHYGVPIAPFKRAFQPDLDSAYRSQNPARLPFSFGYNSLEHPGDRANIMLGRKSAARIRNTS